MIGISILLAIEFVPNSVIENMTMVPNMPQIVGGTNDCSSLWNVYTVYSGIFIYRIDPYTVMNLIALRIIIYIAVEFFSERPPTN